MNPIQVSCRNWLGLCAAILVFASVGVARAADNRYTLVSQSDWNNKHGFYIDCEGSSQGDAVCPLSTMKLAMGVADGTNWRFALASPGWQYNRDYDVKAQIQPTGMSLWLDGQLVQESQGGYSPNGGDLTAGLMQSWATAAAEYRVVEEALTITSGTAKKIHLTFPPPTSTNIARSFFGPDSSATVSGWHPSPSDTITIEARFRIIPSPHWRSFAPLIDRYGQSIYSSWPGKVKNDAQIWQSTKQEDKQLAAWGVPKQFDKYGGDKNAGWKGATTGFYHLAKRNGKWWLITPLGNPCFYTGLCNAPLPTGDVTPVTDREQLFAWLPPKTGLYASTWAGAWGGPGSGYTAFAAATEIRMHGAAWKSNEIKLAERRYSAWGFSGIGKWDSLADAPSTPVLQHGDVTNIGRHPDIFNPDVQDEFKATLRKQILPRIKDPNVVGWSLGNEYDEIVTPDEVTTILSKDEHTPAKRALVDYAIKSLYHGDLDKMAGAWKVTARLPQEFYAAIPTPPAADVEQLRRFYADHYYDFIYKTVKAIDPNHLYLGFWIVPYWWVNEADWSLIAPHCDVIGYDRYAARFSDPNFDRWMRSAGKPILCGEFSFPPTYNGAEAFGTYPAISVSTDAQAGDDYTRWVKDAAQNPYCVGVCWFEYRDEPITGRGPGTGQDLIIGEDYAFGLVDVTGRPKWDLVDRVRQANLAAPGWRLSAQRATSANR
ncbi:MAG TPA: hypothetical protein VFW40_06800 [Capsulimonadaceae bacterium]|nr:hypothetical protein [Capsulimonadaceae bacterium]